MSAGGFQLALLSVPHSLRVVVDAVLEDDKDQSSLDRIAQEIWGYSQKVSLTFPIIAFEYFPISKGPKKIN